MAATTTAGAFGGALTTKVGVETLTGGPCTRIWFGLLSSISQLYLTAVGAPYYPTPKCSPSKLTVGSVNWWPMVGAIGPLGMAV
jgi:hypothetical protein